MDRSAIAWGVFAFGLLIVAPPLLWLVDEEIFVTVVSVLIIGLPILDLGAATWFLLAWIQTRSLIAGLLAVIAAVSAFADALVAVPAYRRMVDLPSLDNSELFIGWSVVVLGSLPALGLLFLLAERRRRRRGRE